jgi:hypothetical protein
MTPIKRGTARRLGLKQPRVLTVSTWQGGEWVKTGGRIDYRRVRP